MDEWQSGLLPYPLLLASQILILGVLVTVCMQFSRGSGYFVRRHGWLATPLWIVGWIYAGWHGHRTRYCGVTRFLSSFHIVLATSLRAIIIDVDPYADAYRPSSDRRTIDRTPTIPTHLPNPATHAPRTPRTLFQLLQQPLRLSKPRPLAPADVVGHRRFLPQNALGPIRALRRGGLRRPGKQA